MSTELCPYLGDTVHCIDCGTSVHYEHTVSHGNFRMWLSCPKCAMLTALSAGPHARYYRCVNCTHDPVAHRDGRCLFGSTQYAVARLDWSARHSWWKT